MALIWHYCINNNSIQFTITIIVIIKSRDGITIRSKSSQKSIESQSSDRYSNLKFEKKLNNSDNQNMFSKNYCNIVICVYIATYAINNSDSSIFINYKQNHDSLSLLSTNRCISC